MLYSFGNWRDAGDPIGGVVEDSAGNLYGTTVGKSSDECSYYERCGTVFKLYPNGTLVTLYQFDNLNAAAEPEDSLILDASGNLYGTTAGYEGRSYSYGNVFELTP